MIKYCEYMVYLMNIMHIYFEEDVYCILIGIQI